MEKKKRNKKKKKFQGSYRGSLAGLGSTFLAYLDLSDENKGLVLREMKWGIMAVQCGW